MCLTPNTVSFENGHTFEDNDVRTLLMAMVRLVVASVAQAEISFDWATVGDPGGARDTQLQGCFGSVTET